MRLLLDLVNPFFQLVFKAKLVLATFFLARRVENIGRKGERRELPPKSTVELSGKPFLTPATIHKCTINIFAELSS